MPATRKALFFCKTTKFYAQSFCYVRCLSHIKLGCNTLAGKDTIVSNQGIIDYKYTKRLS